jgi:hypothetical protein
VLLQGYLWEMYTRAFEHLRITPQTAKTPVLTQYSTD